MGLYSIYRPGPSAPIWIDAPSGEPHVMMACPECLRTFTQVLGKTGCLIRETCCVYCHSLIHYAIVQPTNQTSSRAFQWKPILEIPPPRTASVSTNERKREKLLRMSRRLFGDQRGLVSSGVAD
jgi:hypothetical protein